MIVLYHCGVCNVWEVKLDGHGWFGNVRFCGDWVLLVLWCGGAQKTFKRFSSKTSRGSQVENPYICEGKLSERQRLKSCLHELKLGVPGLRDFVSMILHW